MKKSIFSILCLLFAITVIVSCDKTYDDFMTADVKTGGLVEPAPIIAYLLNATPTVEVGVTVPKGPAISQIEVYSYFVRRADDTYSNKILLKTIDVGSANATETQEPTFSFNYADLTNGVTLGGDPMPADENQLELGDSWYLEYVSVMADGSRKVDNSSVTRIDISNRWTGSYLLSGFVLRAGDPVLSGYYTDVPWKLATNGKKSVIYWKTHLWGDGSTVGGIGPWVINIDDSNGPENPMPITVTDAVNGAVQINPEYNNRYEPSTKTFYLSVFWGNGPAHRAATDTLVYSGPY
jgi:hypothetical protein